MKKNNTDAHMERAHVAFYNHVTGNNIPLENGARLGAQLLRFWREEIEPEAYELALRFCNGPQISEDHANRIERTLTERIKSVYNGNLPEGLFFNKDARGYACKIDSEVMAKLQTIPNMPMLYTDWGGYGLLAYSENE